MQFNVKRVGDSSVISIIVTAIVFVCSSSSHISLFVKNENMRKNYQIVFCEAYEIGNHYN